MLEERRGKASIGRRPAGAITTEDKLKRAEARIKLLEAENNMLKKLEALERQSRIRLKPSERFQMLNQTLRLHGLRRMTRYLCQVAEVSPSGYYRWCRLEEKRQLREAAVEREAKAGALVIKMRLERLKGIVMNHKKIRRLMRKFRLVAVIRHPYRKMAKKMLML
ncbi:IS3 family transposase [Paenibacillus apiarius]|uniref:IS3 family transposase n=1 Tax=Paenibacillus apiarius TaxID=46240 RepID=A0ABT4DWB5_9BACL|nr:IS3 family transposase [Paenibacillus apiarius]MCY9514407.1 IS3 family transposase [Paenibacillus apiarius]MCY9521055.1 IS3 family transposase [Paenibacillus apiarius]MCY9551902.1 IS3 family transposase [Paenibacillus apiarius]MCY9557789.1 IS3 family transposase [Paenibacillus apiarius]MCY9684476.1 IS3 family transposase [Paenibacillus apiarius]